MPYTKEEIATVVRELRSFDAVDEEIMPVQTLCDVAADIIDQLEARVAKAIAQAELGAKLCRDEHPKIAEGFDIIAQALAYRKGETMTDCCPKCKRPAWYRGIERILPCKCVTWRPTR